MKLGVKLITGFFVVALLVGFVGFFGITSNNTIQKNNEIAIELIELENLLDDSLVQILQLIETQNIDDYNTVKSDFESIRAEFDVLHEKHDEIIDRLVESFNQNVDDFTKISNRILAVHQEKLARQRAFDEKKDLEDELRLSIQDPLFTFKDPPLHRSLSFLQIYGKESLYQYKDKEHVDKWLETIEIIRNNPDVQQFPDAIDNLNLYKRTAQDLGIIVVDQQMIEAEERRKVQQLREIIDRLEEDEEKIVNTIQAESKSLAMNTTRTLLIVILIAFIGSIVLGLYIARSISRPIIKLKDSADKISKGLSVNNEEGLAPCRINAACLPEILPMT